MRVLVAGSTGAIGRPLIQQLLLHGHKVFGMVRSEAGAVELGAAGAEAVVADALDTSLVRTAVECVRPEVIINELTSLPRHYTPNEMKTAAERDARVRLEGNRNLLAAALTAGVRRFMVQSSAFWYAPGDGFAEENEPFAFDATPAIATGTRRYSELESQILGRSDLAGVALRYGFFYGPGTWFSRDGDIGDQVRQQQVPIIGAGQGVWSWVHVEDAATATVAALEAAPGAYNIVDDMPAEQRVWLPGFAKAVGAQAPPRVSEEQANQNAGPDAVYYATKLRGASNAKARRQLNFRPRALEWLKEE